MTWIDWYNSLAKPSWTPVPSAISLIWMILYPVILVGFGFVFVQAFRGKVPWRGANEHCEGAALGKKLVDQDRAHGVGLLVRLEIEQAVRHGPPNAHRLVRFAGVGHADVLKDRLDCLRHVSVRDGDKVVVHGRISPHTRRHIPSTLHPERRKADAFVPLCRGVALLFQIALDSVVYYRVYNPANAFRGRFR